MINYFHVLLMCISLNSAFFLCVFSSSAVAATTSRIGARVRSFCQHRQKTEWCLTAAVKQSLRCAAGETTPPTSTRWRLVSNRLMENWKMTTSTISFFCVVVGNSELFMFKNKVVVGQSYSKSDSEVFFFFLHQTFWRFVIFLSSIKRPECVWPFSHPSNERHGHKHTTNWFFYPCSS